MLTKIVAVIQAWKDPERRIPLFAPDTALLEILAEGHRECSAGYFTLAPGDPAFQVPRGSLTNIRAALIMVEGPAGADLTINGAGTPRQIRPPSDESSAEESTPRAFYLETSDDLSETPPFEIAHPGGTEPIEGLYVLIGDPAA